MRRFRRGELDVNNNLQRTSEREGYALFTTPSLEIPNVIVVRKEQSGSLSVIICRG